MTLPVRQRPLVRLAAVLASVTLVPLAALPSLASAPASTPHPAAPLGGCAVTQDATVHHPARTQVSGLQRTAARRTAGWARQLPDGRWQARVDVASRWKGRATATTSADYASADCDVASRTITTTRTRATSVRVTWSATRKASTRKGAINAAIRTAKEKSKKVARRELAQVALDAAGLAARQSFLDALPKRDAVLPSVRPMPTRTQACPTRLASASDEQWSAAEHKGTLVPQFSDAAATWVCRYSHVDGKVVERTKVTGAAQRRLVAGLRSLVVPDPRMAEACIPDLGSTYLVTHVTARGLRTGVVINDFGCRSARLTPDPKLVAAGTTVSPGVPSGRYRPSDSLLKAIRSA